MRHQRDGSRIRQLMPFVNDCEKHCEKHDCAEGRIDLNTTGLTVMHPSYAPGGASVGRGISGVGRIDLQLQTR